MEDCVFCKIIKGEIPAKVVYEDDKIFSFHDISPQAPVHVLVIPKTHMANLNEVDEGNIEFASHLMKKIPEIAKQLGLNNGYRVVFNTEKHACQTVFHLHAHILGGRQLSGRMV